MSAFPPVSVDHVDARSALMTEKELAARWGVSPASLANDRSAGRGLPYVKLSPGRVRYRLADVLAHEASSLTVPQQ